jgi:hypothetical protein
VFAFGLYLVPLPFAGEPFRAGKDNQPGLIDKKSSAKVGPRSTGSTTSAAETNPEKILIFRFFNI